MNPDTAELALAEPASEPQAGAPAAARAAPARRRLPTPSALIAAVRADPERLAAVRVSRRALIGSRLFVWAVGVGAFAAFGDARIRGAFNPPGITSGFGWLGDALAAPATRWDSDWYLVIARFGYRPDLSPYTSPRTAYFPLYPLALRALGWLGSPLVLAGVLISLCALALALYGIHRLTLLEVARSPRLAPASQGGRVARLAVLVTAFSPMAFFFSAVYTDALYMALSIGLFWAARRGRFGWAALAGALAGATRSTGLMLAVPAILIYLYGPREDRPPDRLPRPAASRARALGRALVPRYRVRRDAAWLLLLPAGAAAYCVWLALNGGELLGPFHAEQAWAHHFAGPYVGAWDGLRAGWDGLRQLLSMQTHHVYFRLAGGSPYVAAWHNLMELAFLVLAVPAVVGVLRRLPLAYGAYVLAALALPLSYPVKPQPLMSLPRYLVVLFPLAIWLAAWLAGHPRLQRPAFVVSLALMGLFTAQFSTWHWVA